MDKDFIGDLNGQKRCHENSEDWHEKAQGASDQTSEEIIFIFSHSARLNSMK